jgi:hypothetical protein
MPFTSNLSCRFLHLDPLKLGSSPEEYKRIRPWLIYGSYATVALATMAVVGFLILRIA